MDILASRQAGSITPAPATAELATLALDARHWSVEAAKAMGIDPAPAIAALIQRWTPLKGIEPQGGEKTNGLKQSLEMIGAKIAPSMSSEQVSVWIIAMVEALSDLPYAFALRGAADAKHIPCRFLNEVEAVIREKAKDAETRHKMALNRLRSFQRELRRAGKPALPAPEPRELTQAEIDAMPIHLLRLGLKLGHITQEQFDAARKDEDAHS